MSTLFQDSQGTAPVTAVTQPIGMVLDKSQGLVLGAELVTNGNFRGGTTGWVRGFNSVDGVLSVSSGVATYTVGAGDGGYPRIVATVAGCVVGRYYKVTFDKIASTGTGDRIVVWTSSSDGTGGISFIGGWAAESKTYYLQATATTMYFVFCTALAPAGSTISIDNVSVRALPGNHATQPTAGSRPLYQVVSGYGCAQFDAVNDALLFPAITFGGAFNTFVAGKVTGSPGLHLWRPADSPNGFWAAYSDGNAGSPTATGVGTPSYAVNGVALSPVTREQLYWQINNVASVTETTGLVLSAETALQMAGYSGYQFQGNSHRILMISGTLTAAEKLLCRQWCAEGNGATVV
jgi:hypothetical protein